MCNNVERRMSEHESGEFEGFASKCAKQLIVKNN
jgi:predicted GIY-YIG superfamily endonuclease